MSRRAEACRIAKEMAEQHGGKPADYMGEAWRIVKEGDVDVPMTSNMDVSFYAREGARAVATGGSSLLGTVGKIIARKAWNGAKKGAKNQARNWNMMKAPKDSPKDVFSGLSNMVTKRPDKVEIPERVTKAVKEEVTKMFKFW